MVCRNGSNQVAGLLLSLWCNKGSFACSLYLTPGFSVFSPLSVLLFNDVLQYVYIEYALMCECCFDYPQMFFLILFFYIMFLVSLSCTSTNACMHLHTLGCSNRRITMCLAFYHVCYFFIVCIETCFHCKDSMHVSVGLACTLTCERTAQLPLCPQGGEITGEERGKSNMD